MARGRGVAVTAILFLLATLMLPVAGAKAQTPKRLVAYYYFEDQPGLPKYTADNVPYAKLTHLIHVLAQPNRAADGNIVIAPGVMETNLISRAHQAGVKVLVCVQGPAAVFRKIAGSATARAFFAASLKDFLVRYDYDGVDIDWEVPKGVIEAADCTAMMQALRNLMPSPRYVLSMATTSTPGGWGDFDFKGLTPILDFYNVMTYDYHGPWSKRTGHNSPLFASTADNKGSLDDTVNLYLNKFGVPPEKINLGMAFYGYEFPAGDINQEWNPGLKTKSRNYGPYIKSRINQNGWVRRFDPAAMAPYLVHETPPGFITYDDAESTARKVTYALQMRNLGGVFMWELAADFDGKNQDLLDAMHEAWQRAAKESH